jgi:hypothetical protein
LENFTADSQTALPKEEVYDFYVKSITSKPISTADFGKLMRQVFPEVKARRLGQRGASKYCYANIRKRSEYDLEKPRLLEIKYNIEGDYMGWAKANFGIDFSNLPQLLAYLKCNNFKNVLVRKRRNSSFSNKKSGNHSNKEDNEIKKYFTSPVVNPLLHHPGNNSSEFPQLRNLLSSSSASSTCSEFTPISKKRHFSNNVVAEASKAAASLESSSSSAFRSASVPIFDRFLSSSADSGYDSVHSNTPNVLDNYNPLLSSVSVNNDVFDSVFELIANDNEDSRGNDHHVGGGVDHHHGANDNSSNNDYFEY